MFFKAECFQKTGSFKIRGATNAVYSLSVAEAARGVATHSSGNHGAALARAARCRGIPVTVVMPRTAPAAKQRAVHAYGARVIHCDRDLRDREATLAREVERSGAVTIPPYDDFRIICGQATVFLECLEDKRDLDALIVPVGGGGLLSGTLAAMVQSRARVEVFGAEPRAVDDAARSVRAGRRLQNPPGAVSIADGLLTTLGSLTFPIVRDHVTDLLTVTEEEIVTAMRLIWERLKVVIEPSGAVAFAALLTHQERFRRRHVGVVLSGGNVDLDRLPFGPSSPIGASPR